MIVEKVGQGGEAVAHGRRRTGVLASVAMILRNKSSEFRVVIQYGLVQANDVYTNFHSERHSTFPL